MAVVSWNQVGRIDLTPVPLLESALLTLSRRRLWYRRNHPCRDENDDVLDIPCNMEVLGLKVWCDASDLSIYDSNV